MATKNFNAEYGFSVGNASALVNVVDANANANFVAITANGNINFTGSNVSLGSVSNLKITGGSSNYYLQTDGTGNLSWVAISSSTISNGNSNVNIPAANGNINLTAVGNVTLVVTGTGINVAGTLNATGNANVGNIGAVNGVFTNVSGNGSALSSITGGNVSGQVSNALVAGTVYTAAQPNITSVSTSFTNLTFANAQTISGNNITLTTGSTSNNGTLTGNWTISSSSKLQSSDGNASNILYGNGVFAAAPVVYNNSSVATFLASFGSNTIVTTGNITGGNFIGPLANGNSNVNIPAANGNINLTAVGNVTLVVTGTGINVAGTLNATGNANIGNLGTGQILATANITSPQLISNVATGTAPLVVTSTTQVANLNVETAGSATTAGTVTTNAQPNITSLGTLSSLSVTGNTSAANFVGALANGNSSVSIPTANGNINLNAAGNVTPEFVVTSTGANVNGTLTISGSTSLKTYTETGTTPAISANTLTIDLSTGSFFSVTVNSNITTINITNTPATAGVVSGFVVVFTYNGTPYSVTWPAAIRWANGNVAPTLTTTNNKRDVFTFFTTDNGTSYNGFITGQNI